MRTASIAAMAVLMTLAACDRPGERPEPPAGAPAGPAAPAFRHEATTDLSGYYMPSSEVRIGKWGLNHIFVGQAAEFEAWTGAGPGATFAPVMLQFDDVTSPMTPTELGPTRSVSARVLPTRYTVTDDRIVFEGRSAELGEVRFDGRIDQGALATARRNLGDDGTTVTGTLTAAGETVRGLRLRWWMGD
jgi:hypothetical protein